MVQLIEIIQSVRANEDRWNGLIIESSQSIKRTENSRANLKITIKIRIIKIGRNHE
jgi:hypothetical protein